MARHNFRSRFLPILAALSWLVPATSPSQAAIVRVGTGISHGKFYEVYRSDQLLLWSDARDYAEKTLKAKLVSIGDVSENIFVSSLIKDLSLWVDSNSPAGNLIGPYLGLSQLPGRSEPSGGWFWQNGSPLMGYANWFSNQPDNYNDDNVGVFYNAFAGASVSTPWGDVHDSWTISKGPYSPGPNPFLANSFVVESPFPLSAITRVSSGVNNGSLFEVYRRDTPLTFAQAQAYTRDVLGTHLAVIKDAAQNMFVSSLITDPGLWHDSGSPSGNYIGPYIGLYQLPGSAEPDSGWYWADQTPLNGYTNWFSNQPDNYNGDNVGVFYNGYQKADHDSMWGDVFNGLTISVGPYSPGPNPFLANSFVVQYSQPVPGPLAAMGLLIGFRWSKLLRQRCWLHQRKVIDSQRTASNPACTVAATLMTPFPRLPSGHASHAEACEETCAFAMASQSEMSQ